MWPGGGSTDRRAKGDQLYASEADNKIEGVRRSVRMDRGVWLGRGGVGEVVLFVVLGGRG
jgi:hypothetical protein